MRAHRSQLERLIYAEVFRCTGCDTRVARLRPSLRVHLRFVFSRYTHCIQCGTASVHRTPRRHRIDSLTGNPLGRIQQVLGAPVNTCIACRLQYYDWRRPRLEGSHEE